MVLSGEPARREADLLGLAPMLSDAIDCIGAARFDKAFLQAINGFVRVDHYTINCYSRTEGISSVTVASRVDAAAGRSLTRDYISGYFRMDPNFPDLEHYRRTRKITVRPLDLRRIMSRDYLNRFHAPAVSMDKIALIWYADFKTYNLNLYRTVSTGRYSDSDRDLIVASAGLLTSIARQHSQHVLAREELSLGNMQSFLERISAAAQTPLTRRELDVVARMALGYSQETIAGQLGIGFESAVSYRKRAYRKLAISSQAELFGLCVRNLHRFAR